MQQLSMAVPQHSSSSLATVAAHNSHQDVVAAAVEPLPGAAAAGQSWCWCGDSSCGSPCSSYSNGRCSIYGYLCCSAASDGWCLKCNAALYRSSSVSHSRIAEGTGGGSLCVGSYKGEWHGSVSRYRLCIWLLRLLRRGYLGNGYQRASLDLAVLPQPLAVLVLHGGGSGQGCLGGGSVAWTGFGGAVPISLQLYVCKWWNGCPPLR